MPLLQRRPTWGRRRALRHAAAGLEVSFQPICDLRTGNAVGYEALSRFPSGSPAAWFKEAHVIGLGELLEITAFDKAVTHRVPEWGYVSVNVSPATLVSPAFRQMVGSLREPRCLVLELTEHAAVQDYRQLCAVVGELREHGVKFAVDDAGSGISSFRHILMVAPEIIKLDRSLVTTLDTSAGHRALAQLMAEFCGRMGAELVAEGIERDEERTACLEQGITLGQGYLLGKPAPPPRPCAGHTSESRAQSQRIAVDRPAVSAGRTRLDH